MRFSASVPFKPLLFLVTLLAVDAFAASGFLYVLSDNTTGNQIYGYSADETTGQLTALAGFPVASGGNGIGAVGSIISERLAVDRWNGRLYAVNAGSNTVSAFSIDRLSGALSAMPFSPINLGMGSWTTVAVHPRGSPLIVGNGTGATLSSFNITDTTAVAATGSPFATGANAAPYSCAFSKDGSNVYTGGNAGNAFAIFLVQATTGVLTSAGAPIATSTNFPLGFCSDTGGRLYMANFIGGAVRLFRTLDGVPISSDSPAPSGMVNPTHAALHPREYYIVVDGSGNQIGVFVNAGTVNSPSAGIVGALTPTNGAASNTVVINQAGTFVFVSNANSRNLSIFPINPFTGALGTRVTQPADTLGTTGRLTGMAYLAPASAILYAFVGDTSNRIYGYSCDEAAGTVALLSGFPYPVGGSAVDTLRQSHIAVDSVNSRLFAIDDGQNTLKAFSIDRLSGKLTPLPFSPVSLGTGAWNTVAVHPSGSPVVVLDITGNKALSLSVTDATSTLAPGSPYTVMGPVSAAFSQDGSYLYTGASAGAGALLQGFSVNAASGALSALSGSPFNTVDANPVAVTTDPAGRVVLICGANVRAFTTSAGIPSPVTGNPFNSTVAAPHTGVLHPNGYYMVGDFDKVHVFKIQNGGAGTTLSAAPGSPNPAVAPRQLALSDTGKTLFSADNTRIISTFSVNRGTGQLGGRIPAPPGQVGNGGQITGLTFLAGPVDYKVDVTGDASVIAGSGAGNLTYTVTVTNNGPAHSADVIITNTPTAVAGVTVNSSTPSQGTYDTVTGRWLTGSLAIGGSATLTLTFTAGSSAPQGAGIMGLTSEVVAGNAIMPGDDSATATTTITREADLKVTVVDAPHTVTAGSGAGNLVYTVTLTNDGPSDASNIKVTNTQTLPIGVTLVSATPDVGTFTNGTWTVPSLASGASAVLTVTNTVGPSAASGTNTISNKATITSANETLLNTGDDTAMQTSNVTRSVDLTVTVADAPHVAVSGSSAGNLIYTVTVKNNGPSNASGVTVSDTQVLPAGVTFVSATTSVGTFANNSWSLGTLASGSTATLTIINTVASSAATATASIINSAAITAAAESLINPTDDAASVSTNVTRSVDLSVTITGTPQVVEPGSGIANLVYTITLKNNGPSDATGIAVSNTQNLPAGVTFASASPAAGTSFNSANGAWTVPSLASGGSVTLSIANTVSASATVGTNVIGDTATVTAAVETLVNTTDDAGTAATSISTDVVSAPTAIPSTAKVGRPIAFAVVATGTGLTYLWNFGDGSSATGATVTHAFAAAGLYNVSVTVSGGIGGPQIKGVLVTIVPATGTPTDSDGDGFPNSVEILAGTDPNDTLDTPTGEAVDPPEAGTTPFDVLKTAIKLSFASAGKDTITFSGTLAVPADFVVSGQKVFIDVGGVARGFTLDAKGGAKKVNDTFKMTIKAKKGVVPAQSAKYTVSFKKGAFAEDLASSGLTGDADVKNEPRTLLFTVVFNKTTLEKNQPLIYSAKKGKTGAAK